MVTADTITDNLIRALHNTLLEDTVTHAAIRHLCYVALGERCIPGDVPVVPYRYPSGKEMREAKERLAEMVNDKAIELGLV